MLSSTNPINRYQDNIHLQKAYPFKHASHLQNVTQILENYQFIQYLTESEKDKLLKNIKIVRYFHQQIVYLQNEVSTDINIILSGSLKLGWNTLTGQYHTEVFMPAGTMINIVPVLSELPLIHEHTAQGETIIANIPGHIFAEILQSNAKAQYSILKLICIRTQVKREKVIFDSTQSLLSRLCKELVFLVDYHANQNGIKLNQSSFAELLRTTRQKINKEFAHLVELNIVEVKYNHIEILNYPKLKQFAEGSHTTPITEFI